MIIQSFKNEKKLSESSQSRQSTMQQDQNEVIFKWSSHQNMNSSEACLAVLPHTKKTPTVISGWLYKMRRKSNIFAPTWDKRWVVIQNDSISWRHSKTSEVAGSIDLSRVDKIYKIRSLKKKEKGGRDKKNNRHDNPDRIFVLNSRQRTLCLKTRKEEGCDKWVRSIQLQLDLRNGGTFSGPKNEKNGRKSTEGRDKYERMIRSLDKSLQNLSGFGQSGDCHHELNGHWISPSKQNKTNRKNRSFFESTRFHKTKDDIFGSISEQKDNTLYELLRISSKEEQTDASETMILV